MKNDENCRISGDVGDNVSVDYSTGELLSLERSITTDLDSYMLLYMLCTPNMPRLSNAEKLLVLMCWKNSIYEESWDSRGNIFYIGGSLKDKCISAGIIRTYQQFYVVMMRLVRWKLFIKKDKSMFVLNPKYFPKGRITDNTRLGLNITFNAEDCEADSV